MQRRLIALLLQLLIVAVCGLGALVTLADQQARDHRGEFACLARVRAAATVALMAPDARLDADGGVGAALCPGAPGRRRTGALGGNLRGACLT